MFDEIAIGGTLTATEKYREFFKSLHPRQMLTSKIMAPIFEVTYSYVTCRDNYREGKKYVILRCIHAEEEIEIEMLFNDWVEAENKRRPYRKISNVEILEIKPKAYATLSLIS
jgi:hypothetical protein